MPELEQMRGRAELVFTPAAALILLNRCQSNAISVGVKLFRQSRRRSVTLSKRDSTNHRISHFVGLPQPSANASGRWYLRCDSWRVSIGVSINRSQYQQESVSTGVRGRHDRTP
jgi:hypothetical protein